MDRIVAGWKAQDLATDAKDMMRREYEDEITELRSQRNKLRAHAEALAGALEKADKTIRSMRNREGLDPNTREHRERERLLTDYRNQEE